MQPDTTIEETVSRPNHLRFIKCEVESYAGLNYEDKSLVIMFPQTENIVEFQGDQGVGKTSIINGLKALLGNPEPDNALNAKTGNKSASLTFEIGGELYKSRVTNKSFSLVNIKEVNGKPVTSSINSPKAMLANIIGPIGVSPEFLQKKKSGDDQIAWIKDLAKSNSDLAKREADIKAIYKAAFEERTEVNRDVKKITEDIRYTGLYDYNAGADEFLPSAEREVILNMVANAPESEQEVKDAFERAHKKNDELRRAKDKLDQIQFQVDGATNQIAEIDREIERLSALKLSVQEKLQQQNESIDAAKIYIEERKNAPQEFEDARKNLENIGKIALSRKNLQDAAALIAKYKTKTIRQHELNNTMVECESNIKELAKEFTPGIDGLEVELGGSIDNRRPAGVYYHGTNISYLSESELWDLCLQVWKVSGISVVFIENSTSLGSDAISRINWFAHNGGTVFMSTMQRSYKELTVSFYKTKE